MSVKQARKEKTPAVTWDGVSPVPMVARNRTCLHLAVACVPLGSSLGTLELGRPAPPGSRFKTKVHQSIAPNQTSAGQHHHHHQLGIDRLHFFSSLNSRRGTKQRFWQRLPVIISGEKSTPPSFSVVSCLFTVIVQIIARYSVQQPALAYLPACLPT